MVAQGLLFLQPLLDNADTTSGEEIPTDNIIEGTYKEIEKSLYYKNPVSREGRITDVTCLTEMLRANKKIEIEIHISDIKGNVFNPEDLKKAQKEPEKYKNLQIRLCGWNVRFVDLDKAQQDEFIKQSVNNL